MSGAQRVFTDADALRYAGIMGHPFAVTCDDRGGHRRTAGEFNTREQALKHAGETPNGRAWRRTKRGYIAVKPTAKGGAA